VNWIKAQLADPTSVMHAMGIAQGLKMIFFTSPTLEGIALMSALFGAGFVGDKFVTPTAAPARGITAGP